MNKKQKEVQQAYLDNEKAVLRELTHAYNDSLAQINQKIELLLARQDADMQNVIYQVEHQKALKTQVQSILEQLQANEFETVSEFLANSYTDGFVGSMYDMHGQGVPLIIPIDQEQVVAAIKHDTKLSENLYTSLGKDVKLLNKQIAGEISRGIASGQGYMEITRNIANYANIPKNRAMTIARTESHRIQCKATLDAQHKAKEKGADVLKMWDAALDGDTRPSHRKLDGQIRELDEPFEVDGHKAMHPSGFGRPKEDINCRCALLQRARWALDEAELEKLKERAEYFELDKTKDFEDFKKKYLKAAEEESVLDSVQKKNIEDVPKKAKITNKNGEEIQFNLDGMSEEGQKYVKEKVELLATEYNTSIVDIQYDRTLKNKNGCVDSLTGRVMQLKSPYAVEHEIFHTFDSSKRLKFKNELETNEEFWKESRKLFNEYKKVAIRNSNIRISEYSLTDVDEFMAEAFGTSKGGIPSDTLGVGAESPYAKKALSIIDKYFKKDVVENIGESGTIYIDKKIGSYLEVPKSLGETTHKEKHDDFIANGVDVKPLSKGSLKGVKYEDGGGYKVNGSEDGQYLQYHPANKSHHKGEYYKLSSGKTGTKRYDMDGNLIE